MATTGINLSPFVTFLIICLVPVLFHIFSISRSVKTLPPGSPRRLFSSPNASNSPLWKRINELHARYGPVVSMYQGRNCIISLGTIKAATDLLEKRGSIYSSRPRNIMGEILTGGMRGLSMPYGTRWRNWRSLMHAGMSIEASQNYKLLQSVESKILLRDLLKEESHEMYNSHFQRFAVSIASCISYGRRIQSLDDPKMVAQHMVDGDIGDSFGAATSIIANSIHQIPSEPGRYIVQSWPFLLKLPRFLQWFRWAPEEQRKRDTTLLMSLMIEAKEQINLGVAQPSVAKRGLEKQSDFGLNDVETAYALSAPFTAGVATTTSVLQVTLLAMLHYPDAMKKAQAEIDDVVGASRMPYFEDADSLPYVGALIREVLRWRPILPLSIPHSIIADDVYDSMHIPNGSTVIPNLDTMSKDENIFPSPDVFSPERYLKHGPHSTFYFGFGRRICPGMHVAQNSLFIIITRLLWGFDILPSTDEQGRPLLPSVDDFVGGLVRFPTLFAYILKQRSGTRSSLIENSAEEAEAEASTQWL